MKYFVILKNKFSYHYTFLQYIFKFLLKSLKEKIYAYIANVSN
jgi:hypothetical protein